MGAADFDFHCHSRASDGQLTPIELVQRASHLGIQHLALTDHDTLAGYRSLVAEDLAAGLNLISGVEWTVSDGGRIYHLVSLGLDADAAAVLGHERLLDQIRQVRAERISERLVKNGLPALLDEALVEAEGAIVTRPHFAKAMVRLGLVRGVNEAFDRYLGRGKVGDVKMDWPSMQQVVEMTNAAGGVSVIAHPTKYNMTATKIRQALIRFKSYGGDAVETSYPGMTKDQHIWLDRFASQLGFSVSSGSDFHFLGTSWQELGRFPIYKSACPHVKDQLINQQASL